MTTSKSRDISIKSVEPDALEDILKLAESVQLGTLPEASAQKNGFLVSGFNLQDYQNFLEITEYFYVVEEDNKITAFLLAYHSDQIKSSESVDSLLKYAYYTPFILIKQICVAPSRHRQGLGSLLYQHLISQKKDTSMLAAIVTSPPNFPSMQFHQALGFKEELEIMAPDGRPRSIWHRPPSKLEEQRFGLRIKIDSKDKQFAQIQSHHQITQLLSQYSEANKLYTHEDNLNWKKLDSFFTINIFLAAGYAYFWNNLPSKGNTYPVWGLFIFALLINLLFQRKIKSGVAFLSQRKNKTIRIEKQLLELNPQMHLIVGELPGKSATVRLLEYLPIIGLFIWVVSICILMSRIYF